MAQKAAAASVPDSEIVYRVWRTPVTMPQYVDGAWQNLPLALTEAMSLNIEVSWPAQKPYARRHKSLYSLEVYKTL
jgi:hypothetical protein